MEKNYLIEKWLKGELTEAEQKAFEQLPDYRLNQKIIEGAKQFKAPRFSPEQEYTQLLKQLPPKSKSFFGLNTYQIYRIAAILIIALSGYFFMQSATKEFTSGAGQKLSVNLPDGSIVVLNSASGIQYNSLLWRFKRSLKMDGEAFFKVQKGSKFDVHTANGIVSVVGTQFDVKSRNHYFEVSCYEGIVKVTTRNKTEILPKGKSIRMIKEKVILAHVEQTKPPWLDNQSSFKSVPLAEVIKELERQYGIKVITKRVDVNQLYTGGFGHDNLEQAVEAIAEPFDLEYTINPSQNSIFLSGK